MDTQKAKKCTTVYQLYLVTHLQDNDGMCYGESYETYEEVYRNLEDAQAALLSKTTTDLSIETYLKENPNQEVSFSAWAYKKLQGLPYIEIKEQKFYE